MGTHVQNPAVADIDLNSNQLANLADASASGQAVAYGQGWDEGCLSKGITEKLTIVDNDLICIFDSEDSYNPKYITLATLSSALGAIGGASDLLLEDGFSILLEDDFNLLLEA